MTGLHGLAALSKREFLVSLGVRVRITLSQIDRAMF